MAMNWYTELTKLAKTNPEAKELLSQLKNATTDEEKEKAKENGKKYIESLQAEIQTSDPETPETTTETETEVVPEDMDMDQDDIRTDIVAPVHVVQEKQVEKKFDMSEPAFNPRLAKMGITREEELFKMGVYVRKLTREEKIEIRRSIYQKRKSYMSNTQERFKEERAKKLAALKADPEYQKYLHQQQLVIRIVEALKAHCNVEWMLKNIPGLTVDIIRELLQTPANVNQFREQKAEFVENFYKKFGK
jgi:hypothetical protein